MDMFARFDENPAMTLQDIKETKRYGRTDTRTHTHTHACTDNVKTVYSTTNKVCGGYNKNIIDHGREILVNIGENFNWLCVSLAGGPLILVFFIYLWLSERY